MIDANLIIRTVHAANDAAYALREAARLHGNSSGDYITGSRPEAPAPIRLDLFDQAELIHYQLQGWARICEEEHGAALPADETSELARFLREESLWIADQPWAEDMVSELRDEVHTAEGKLGTLPKRIALPTPCECGQRRWGYLHEGQGGMHVECADGHAQTLDQAAGDQRALVSIRGAQRVFGIRRTTISEAVREDRVVNHGTEDRPLVDTFEMRAYLQSVGGDHKV